MNNQYWFDKAENYESDGNYSEALKCYKEILDDDPSNIFALTNTSYCLMNMKKFEEAIKFIDLALYFNSKFEYAWNVKGWIYQNMGEYFKSVEFFDKSLSINPQDKFTWYFKAQSLYYINDLSGAIECLETSLKIDPNDNETKKFLNQIKNENNEEKNVFHDEKCPYCGAHKDRFQLLCSECNEFIWNSDDDRGFKDSLNNLFDYFDYFDKNDDSNSFFINEWKKRGLSVRLSLLSDLGNWLSFLAMGDNYIAQEEIDFINEYLNLNFNKDQIKYLLSTLHDEFINILPSCFVLAYDLELNAEKKFGVDLIKMLLGVFHIIGYLFIRCDGEITEDEYNLFMTYMSNLNKNIEDYKNGDYKLPKSDSNKQYSGTDIKKESTSTKIEFSEDNKTMDDYLDELNDLVGLEKVKEDVNSLINLIQVRKIRNERGLSQPPMSLHLVFSGNPGTGKTTVARLLAKIYHKLGLLSEGHLVETDRSGLVAGYVGQTAIKVQEVINNAMGGVLFIDEAYTLSSSKGESDFGQEAIDTLLKAMEDNRDNLIVVVAGYPDLMQEFLQSNPGLKSRFNKFIFFEDYNPQELFDIFMVMCKKSWLKLDSKAENYLKIYLKDLYESRDDNFANGRDVRNLFEKVLANQANRLAIKDNISDEELMLLTYDDFNFDMYE